MAAYNSHEGRPEGKLLRGFAEVPIDANGENLRNSGGNVRKAVVNDLQEHTTSELKLDATGEHSSASQQHM